MKKETKVKEMIFPRSLKKETIIYSSCFTSSCLITSCFFLVSELFFCYLLFFHLMFRNLSFFCNFLICFLSLSSSPLFFVQLFFLSFNLFWCLVSKTTCFPKIFFLKTAGIAKKEIWMFFWVFLDCPFFKQRNKIFFKTNKSKKTNLFSDVRNLF